MAPMTSDDAGLTNPALGVIATRPATRPETNPNSVGLRRKIHSARTQDMAPLAAATWVVTNANDALCPAASALPALKPNQPNQRRPAPVTVIVKLCGMKCSRP